MRAAARCTSLVKRLVSSDRRRPSSSVLSRRFLSTSAALMGEPIRRHSLDFLAERASSGAQTSTSTGSYLALVLLNHSLPKRTPFLWDKAQLRVCADGGANRLHRELPALQNRLVPEYIVGDLDSLDPAIRSFYSAKGAKILDKSVDQDTTDLHKCVAFVRDSVPVPRDQLQILVLGALGGRFDHEMGNINVLYFFRDLDMVLLSDDNLVLLLPSGYKHELKVRPGAHCGLVPLAYPSATTTTTGLRWNLDSTPMAFGSVVSTSNIVQDETVTVVSDADLLWTMDIRSWTEQKRPEDEDRHSVHSFPSKGP